MWLKNFGTALVALVVATCAAVGLQLAVDRVGWMGHLELTLSPNRPLAPDRRIALVVIETDTPRRLGVDQVTTIVPRRFHADLLRGLHTVRAKAVLFDLDFSEEFDESQNVLVREAIEDVAPMPVILGFTPVAGRGVTRDGEPVTLFAPNFVKPPLTPDHVMEGSLIPWNPDRVVRGIQMRFWDEDSQLPHPHVAVLGALALADLRPADLRRDVAQSRFVAGGYQWPVGADLEYRARWTASGGEFDRFEYAEALQLVSQGTSTFANRLVLIGSEADVKDYYETDSLGVLSGVEIVGQFVNSLLAPATGQFTRASMGVNAAWATLLGLVAFLAVSTLQPARIGLGLGVSIALAIALPYLSLQFLATRIDTLAPVLTILLCAGASALYVGNRNKRFDPTYGRKPGEPVKAAVLFVDLKGSTSAIADLELAEVEKMLKEVLETLIQVIRSHGGSIERTMGDGVFAMWFARPARRWPKRPANDHLIQCYDATRALLRQVGAMDEELQRKFARRGALTIGVEAGEIVGDVVSEAGHEEWSWFGMPIHVTARLQSLCGDLKVSACLGPTFQDGLGDARHLVPLGEFELKGVPERKRVFGFAPLPRSEEASRSDLR
ncbi:MAG: CHASE2 domain-containing protein [Fimbriimonadaceae bacterium]